ncbi:RWD domain-containing protein 3 isoform X2 [Lingula anatina]|uniref:RWD domain-containing protein 3 n=1 Tax=Lingula anatina TaxID=7574 RepID=A0A1S3JG33_LINAN|nr:RWD domain-containing protein 3 isoform X2 [Lingula anatina]|eukprot:XP_013409101.1 RWD domain-containing protein 3 isoform X2 [Lingula anatina]
MAEDEIEVLQAIFCGPAEFEVFHAKQDIGSSSLYTMKIKIKSESSDTQLKNTQTEIVLDAIFTMKPTYPNSIPDINLKSANLNQEEIEKLTFDLVQFANTLVGEVMVMEIVQWLQQNAVRYSSRVFKTEEKPYEEPEDQDNKPQKCTAKLETLVENVTSPDTQHLSARAKDNCEDIGKEIIVLQLDHMRSKAKYVKTICKWTEQLGLVGRLIFQGKNILIILEGTSANIRFFKFSSPRIKVRY